jgi:hypothetical protein
MQEVHQREREASRASAKLGQGLSTRHEGVTRQEQQEGLMVVVLEPKVQVPVLEQEGPAVAEAADRWDSSPCSSGSGANRVAGEP